MRGSVEAGQSAQDAEAAIRELVATDLSTEQRSQIEELRGRVRHLVRLERETQSALERDGKIMS